MDETRKEAAKALPNFDVKGRISEYWSRRSETFDQSPGHGIASKGELVIFPAENPMAITPAHRRAEKLAST